MVGTMSSPDYLQSGYDSTNFQDVAKHREIHSQTRLDICFLGKRQRSGTWALLLWPRSWNNPVRIYTMYSRVLDSGSCMWTMLAYKNINKTIHTHTVCLDSFSLGLAPRLILNVFWSYPTISRFRKTWGVLTNKRGESQKLLLLRCPCYFKGLNQESGGPWSVGVPQRQSWILS